MTLIDTHCHLDFPQFDLDREQVIARAKEQGIGGIVNVGSSLESTKRSLELARQYDFIYAAAGIHPHEADKFDEKQEAEFARLLKREKIVAIGETGLDYFKNFSKAENQTRLFKSLLRSAKEAKLPLVIHCRSAQGDTLKILKEFMPVKAVVHCFSGPDAFLDECLELGLLISFTCNITYKKADDLRGLVKRVPMDRLLLETDAPYLAPEEFRGRRNEPLHVGVLARAIAGLKGISLEEVSVATTLNAKNFFGVWP
jgi:TatD DNase family protein